jgi:hypothetical protein
MTEIRRSPFIRAFVTGLFLVGLLSNTMMPRVQAASTLKSALPGANLLIYSPLEVVINEVAWSGTLSDSSGEWIELYNPGEVDIDLNGWKLVADDSVPSINLSGEILAGDYFLLERTNDQTISNITADQIYTGELRSSNETLRLLAPNDTLIDSANLDGGPWPGGSAFPSYASMERISVVPDEDAAWGNNNGIIKNGEDINGKPVRGTPRRQNSLFTPTDATQTASPTASPDFTPTRTISPTPTLPAPTHLVISQFRTRGPKGEDDEFIEIFNPSNTMVNIGNWQIKKSSECGTVTSNLLTIPTGVLLLAGQRYLAVSQVSTLTGSDLVFTQTIPDEGGLALIQSSGSMVDQVGLCSGTKYLEGNPVSPLTGDLNQGYARKPVIGVRGCVDTNKNSEDFYTLAPSVPKGRAGGISMCPGVMTATPTPRATGTPIGGSGTFLVNEFLPRAGSDWNGDGSINVGDEFIEIINIGKEEASLRGWKLDDADGGSNPYTLPDITLLPGEIEVFYGNETGLVLNDIGDTVRLLRPNSVVVDYFQYSTVTEKDKSWCRFPDGIGAWRDDCTPTPDMENSWGEIRTVTPEPGGTTSPGGQIVQLCPFAETLQVNVFPSNCSGWGLNIWNRSFWNEDFFFVMTGLGKWGVILH